MSKEVLKLDLYHILGVEETASEKEIVKGYRRKALKCHPDKNPDNPKAAEQFHQLSQALEVLTDAAARAAYDRSRKAKKESEARNNALDSKRKKFKEDLEAREQAAEDRLKAQKSAAAEKNLQKEIERLRKEGSRLLEQEQERLRQELRSNRPESPKSEPEEKEPGIARMKLKWKAGKDDSTNGGYNARTLTEILGPYGHINSLIISSKRNGSAIIEFEPSGVSSKILEEKGLAGSPFTMVWLSGRPTEDIVREGDQQNGCYPPLPRHTEQMFDTPGATVNTSFLQASFPSTCFPCGSVGGGSSTAPGLDADGAGKDFESLVLMKMRQAEERKRLIAQMEKDDEANG